MLTADDLAQISQHLLRPLHVRIANLAGRGTVQLVDDAGKLQTLQIGDIPGGPYDGCEHVQPFGFASVPLAGADTAVVVFPNGDRRHPLIVAVGDRRYRPTGGDPGTVTVYNHTGASMTITKDGDIVARPASGRKMLVDDGSGAAALPTMADFQGLITIMSTCGAGPATALPATLANYQAAHPTWPDGTKVLQGK